MSAQFASDGVVVNALTIDVEDYFQVSAFSAHIPRDSWDTLPCRVEANIDCILALLDEQGVHATFFTLGWIAERYPALRQMGSVPFFRHAGNGVRPGFQGVPMKR